MKSKPRWRPFLCRIGLHRWRWTSNDVTGVMYRHVSLFSCERCHKSRRGRTS